jgi:hypothetical protein
LTLWDVGSYFPAQFQERKPSSAVNAVTAFLLNELVA